MTNVTIWVFKGDINELFFFLLGVVVSVAVKINQYVTKVDLLDSGHAGVSVDATRHILLTHLFCIPTQYFSLLHRSPCQCYKSM